MLTKKLLNLIILIAIITSVQIKAMWIQESEQKNIILRNNDYLLKNFKHLTEPAKELKIAIKTNNFENFKRIVESFTNINDLFKTYSSLYIWNPLQDVCKYDRLEMIKYFIEEKKIKPFADFERDGFIMSNNLSLFSFCNKLDTFKYLARNSLLDKDAIIEIRDAASKGNLDITKYLIEEENVYPYNVIQPAFEYTRLNIIKYLETIEPTESNYQFKFSINDIDRNNTFNDKIFRNHEFLQYVLKKTEDKSGKLKLATLFDKKGETLIGALISMPQCIASILSTNGTLPTNKLILEKYLCKSEKELKKDDALKEESKKNIVIQFFIKVIKTCKKTQELYKDMPNDLKNTNTKATNFLNNTQNTLLVLDALSHKMFDDAATSIMEFSDYECFEKPKRGKFIN